MSRRSDKFWVQRPGVWSVGAIEAVWVRKGNDFIHIVQLINGDDDVA